MKKTFKLLFGCLSLAAIVSSCVAPQKKAVLQPTVGKDLTLEEESCSVKEYGSVNNIVNSDSTSLKEDFNRISKTFGHLLIRQVMATEGISFNPEEIIQGIKDELDGKEAPLSDEVYQEKISELQKSFFDKKAQTNLALAETFLKENAMQPDIVEVEANRLQYRILQEGTGAEVVENGTPLIHYKGSFMGGEVFSSSRDLNEPLLLPLSQAIPGFSLGMKGMKEGEKRVLYIHPDLAYGCSGHLPPNSLLIFDIELVKADGVSSKAVEEDIAS
ncbi:MAG: FKBP-type peptidyl-prolyl cis-trans isomerase [Victivallaceae bacterium]